MLNIFCLEINLVICVIILCRLPAFSGINRGASNARGSSNGLANDQQSGENQILS